MLLDQGQNEAPLHTAEMLQMLAADQQQDKSSHCHAACSKGHRLTCSAGLQWSFVAQGSVYRTAQTQTGHVFNHDAC